MSTIYGNIPREFPFVELYNDSMFTVCYRSCTCELQHGCSLCRAKLASSYYDLWLFFVSLTDGFECPACRKLLNIDRDKILALPKNLALENIVARYVEERRRSMCLSQSASLCHDVTQHNPPDDGCGRVAAGAGAVCDLCDTTAAPACRAEWFCAQCSVAYCTACVNKFHPQRGALARHCVHSVSSDGTKAADDVGRLAHCVDHAGEQASMFCDRCKVYVCHLCVCDGEGRHAGHKMLLPETACTMVKVLPLIIWILTYCCSDSYGVWYWC